MPLDANDIIDNAARVFCDSSAHGMRWTAHHEGGREIYRSRMRVVAAAGYLADGTAETERDAAVSDRNRWHNLASEWESAAKEAMARLDAVAKLLDGLHADVLTIQELRAALTTSPTTKDT